MSQPDVTPQDALAIAQQALQKANEVDDVADEIDDLRERVVALELRLSELDDDTEYQSLTLDQKVGMVRQHGFNKATDGHGRATLDYSDIEWEVFDGEPGTNHCYKLIRLAAGLDDEKTGSEYPGFTARDPDGDNYHLAIDADRAKQNAEFYSRNKTDPATAD